MAEKIIFDVTVDTEQANKNVVRLQKELNNLRNAQKDLKKSQKELDAAFKAGSVSADDYARETERLAQEEVKLRKQISNTTSELKQNEKAVETSSNSLAALRQKTAQMTAELSQINTATEEGAVQFAALSQKIKENTEQIKKAEEGYGSFKTNVGNYKQAISDAISENSHLFGSLGETASGVANLGKNFLMAAGLVGALVAVLGVLFSAFSKTEGGAKKIQQIMGGVSNVFNQITGDIGRFVEYISNDPQKAFEGLGDAILENFTNRLKGALDVLKFTGEGIKAFVSGDFDKLSGIGEKIGESVTQAATGIDNLGKKSSDYFGKAYENGVALAKLQQNSATVIRSVEQEVVKLNGLYERQTQIADDDTLSFQERRKATEDALVTSIKLGEAEIKLAQTRLGVINQEIALKKAQGLAVTDLLDAQKDAANAVNEAENSLLLRKQERLTEQRKMERDALEQTLDVLLDSSDAVKTALEREAAMTSGSYEQRLALLEKLKSGTIKTAKDLLSFQTEAENAGAATLEDRIKKAADAQNIFTDATNRFISEIEKSTKIQIDSDALLAEKDIIAQERQVRALGLSEQIQTQLLAFLKDRTAAEVDFAETKNALLDEQIERETKAVEKRIENEKLLQDENLRALEMKSERMKNDSELTAEFLNAQMEQELAAVQHSEELKSEIRAKYAKTQTEISKANTETQLQILGQTAGQAATLFEEQTVAAKTLGIAQASINTYLGVTQALTLPPPASYIAAGVTAAIGFANVAKIMGVQFSDGGLLKFARGGLAVGASHAAGGIKGIVGNTPIEFEGGEFITRKEAVKNSFDAISTINSNPNVKFDAVPKFEFGGTVSTETQNSANLQETILSQKPPVLQVSEYTKVARRVSVTEKTARF